MNTVGNADVITELQSKSARDRVWRDRFEQHLDQIPQLLEVMREQRVPLAAARSDSERVSGGGGSTPLPFRADPVDDCDDLWGALVEYLGEVSERLQDPAPAAIGATWAIDGAVRGMPSWIDGDIAYRAGYVLIAWLVDRALEVRDLHMEDSEDHLFGLVRKFGLRYTVTPIERPARRRWCAVCGEMAVAISWVTDDSGEAACRVCGETYPSPAETQEEGQ